MIGLQLAGEEKWSLTNQRPLSWSLANHEQVLTESLQAGNSVIRGVQNTDSVVVLPTTGHGGDPPSNWFRLGNGVEITK